MPNYNIIFLGDITGKPGRRVVHDHLPTLKNQYQPMYVIANGENAASGHGITPEIADVLLGSGIDGLTLGNHTFDRKEIIPYLDSSPRIVRPANMSANAPGRGVMFLDTGAVEMAVINLSGRVFMEPMYDDPFHAIDKILERIDTPHIFVDFHGEATSEKAAFGFHVAGRVSACIGTHTHVTTADEQILEGGTAFMTDIGMCGPYPSVLGVQQEIVVERFRKGVGHRFEGADEAGILNGVVITIDQDTGRATKIERIRLTEQRRAK